MSAAPVAHAGRRQAAWVLGALALAAWAFWWPYYKDRKDYRLSHPSVPRETPAGAWVHYENARWRLIEARVVAPTDLAGLQLRPDSQVVLATLEVILDNGTAAENVDSCKSVLRDPAGRQWKAQPLALLRYPQRPLGRSCGSRLGDGLERVNARPGRPFRFQQIYQLPRGVPLAGLQLELSLPRLEREERGAYVRFTL